MKKILVIITGSIAAYKSLDLVRDLQKKSYQVKVVLTKSAQEFVTKLLVNSLVGKENVYTELFDESDTMTHISLSREADLVVVAPATANFIAKMANGYCDDLASTVISACNKNVLVAPAMNEKMWKNAANVENVTKLRKSDKFLIVNPADGVLACGEEGVGKMEDIAIIAQEIEDYFAKSICLAGKTIILTGGGTREAIDSVRYISNSSSGKQAVEIAKSLKKAGGDVRFVAANIAIETGLDEKNVYRVSCADEMLAKVNDLLTEFSSKLQDVVFVSCAAVADYRVKEVSDIKLKKEKNDELDLKLVKNVDILSTVAHLEKRPGIVIGFAAEDGEALIENAKSKLSKKNCDLIVANDIKGGEIFGSDQSDAYFVTKDGALNLGRLNKKEVAEKLVAQIKHIYQSKYAE